MNRVTAYAVKCRDGRRNRHVLPDRTNRNLSLMFWARVHLMSCGPHQFLVRAPGEGWETSLNTEGRPASPEDYRTSVLTLGCPQCRANPYEPCHNLRANPGTRSVTTHWPHRARTDAWVNSTRKQEG